MTTAAELLDAQRRIGDAVLASVRRRARALAFALTVALVVAIATLCALASRDARRQTAASHALDSLAAVGVKQDATIRADSIARDSLERIAQAKDSALVAFAARADRTPTPHLRIVGLGTGTHIANTTASSSPASPNGVRVASVVTADSSGALSVRIDSSWHIVYVDPDSSTPHVVDSTIARVLGTLDSTAVQYAQFRDEARATVWADAAALQRADSLTRDERSRRTTAERERDATRALIPSRRQRLWHDVKLVALTIAAYAVVDNVLDVVRVAK